MASAAAFPTDGRLARSARSRRTVVDALLDLLTEGDPRPTAARIAERAGVSLRSVFQHFESLETLLAEAAERQTERMRPLLRPIEATGSREQRLETFVARRSRLLDAVAPVRRAALREESRSAVIAERLRRSRAAGRAEIERVFARELAQLGDGDRREAVAALGAMASFAIWEELRRHQKMPAARARRVVHRMLDAVLPPG
jgi:TetR/AcrR family transcriptional regulator, regulator of autoinduction and epiphytic fitness